MLTSFYRVQSLPRPIETAREDKGLGGQKAQRPTVSPYVSALVSAGLSSYYEIKYQLNAMEVLDLVEVLILKSNQEHISMNDLGTKS